VFQQNNETMGYTHYWDFKKVPTQESIWRAVTEIEVLLNNLPEQSTSAGGYYNEHPIKICGGLGKGKPQIDTNLISFNGTEKGDLGHETFYVDFTETSGFNFCKTARKPYDFAVCLALISLANHIEGFGFSSDGDVEDWQPVIKYYEKFNNNPSENLKKSISSFFQTTENL